MEPSEVYQLAWKLGSWQKMTDEVENIAQRRKLVTANAESERSDAIRYRFA
jgi:hypothetical protein